MCQPGTSGEELFGGGHRPGSDLGDGGVGLAAHVDPVDVPGGAVVGVDPEPGVSVGEPLAPDVFVERPFDLHVAVVEKAVDFAVAQRPRRHAAGFTPKAKNPGPTSVGPGLVEEWGLEPLTPSMPS